MENSEALKVLHNLEELLKKDDKKVLYDIMTHDFKTRVGLDSYIRLEKYRLNLKLPLCLVNMYEASDQKMMLRVKQDSKSDYESFANILFVKEDDGWKLSGVLT